MPQFQTQYQVVARFEGGHESPRGETTYDLEEALRQWEGQVNVHGYLPTTILLRSRLVGAWHTIREADRPTVGADAIACAN